MNQKHTKNRLYMLPALLFYIGLQGTEATQINSTKSNAAESNPELSPDLYNHVSEQTPDVSDTSVDRRHNRPNRPNRPNQKPRPNNAGSQNMAGQYNTHYAAQQNNAGAYNTSYNAAPYDMTGSYNNMSEWQNNAESYNTDYAAQQNNAGFLDTSFGGIGYVINATNQTGFNTAARAVATQKDNKIVVAGIRDDYPTLARYNNDGSLDSSFATAPYGPGTIIQTSLGKGSSFNAVAIQEFDQKIVAVGDVERTNRSPGKCILARYRQSNNSVILDLSFGINGIGRTNIPGELTAVAIDKNGSVVAAGYGPLGMILIRVNVNGLSDNNFGLHGKVFTAREEYSLRPNAIVIQEDNKIVVVGTLSSRNRSDIFVARYFANGGPDTSFGVNGIISLPTGKNNSAAYDVKIQNDGKIIVVGTSISPYDKSLFTIIRLNSDGSTDTSFGNSGLINFTPTGNLNDNAYARSVAIDKNDNIIVMGYAIVRVGSTNNNHFYVVRYNPTRGVFDEAFGNGGRMNTQLTIGNNRNQTTLPVFGAIQDDGRKLILAGNYYFYRADSSPREAASGHRFAVARYWN